MDVDCEVLMPWAAPIGTGQAPSSDLSMESLGLCYPTRPSPPKTNEGGQALIELKPERPEELRKRLREMSNLELRRFGERARKLSDPKMNFGATERTAWNLKRRGRNGADGILSRARHEDLPNDIAFS
jgi:hypothetical protein